MFLDPAFQNPKRFIIPYKVERKYRSHTPEEVQKILNAKVSKKLELPLKMYQFQMKTGMGFSELLAFSPQVHIVRNIHDKKEWINIRRKKNGNLCEIPLWLGDQIPELGGLQELIDYFKANSPNPFGPYKNLGYYSTRLKEIAREIGVDEFTSHVARHTFATICVNSDMEPASVSRMIGDTLQTTMRVYANLDSRRIISDMGKLASNG